MKIVGKTIRIFAAGLMLLALTACTSPQVRTVIVEETLDAGRMEVQNIYDNEEKMDKGYRRYLGFSNTNVLVVLEKKEQKTSLQLMDYKTGKMQSVMPAGAFGEISGASLINAGRDVLIESVRGDSTDIGVINLASRKTRWAASYKTEDVLTYGSASGGQGKPVYVMREGESLLLCVLDPEDLTFETMDLRSAIPAYVQPYLENARVESAFIMGDMQLVATVSDGAKGYILLKNLGKDEEPVILGISSRKVSAGSEKIYYINEEGSLCSFDLETNTESTIAAHVEDFCLSQSSGRLAYSVREDTAVRIFMRDVFKGRGILVDIRADVRGFLLNAEGNKIWIQHTEASKTGKRTQMTTVLEFAE